MTDLVARVLLKADASGLVGQARAGADAVAQIGTATLAAGGQAKILTTATADAGAAVRDAGAAATAAGTAVTEFGAAGLQAGAAAQALATDQRQVASAVKATGTALRTATNDNQRHAFGVRTLGQQFGDLGLSIEGGISPARAFGQQAGQIGYALSEMGGKAGAVGAFLTGPWGIALTIAAAVLAPLVEDLFKAAEAAEAAKVGADGLADAQSVLGGVFDLTSGKIKSQNELLILNARLTAINLRGEAMKQREASRQAFADAAQQSTGDRVKGFLQSARYDGLAGVAGALVRGAGGAIRGTDQGQRNAASMRTITQDLQAGRITSQAALRASERLDFTGTKVTRQQFQQALVDQASADAKAKIATLIDQSLDDGKLADGLRRDTKTAKPKGAKSTATKSSAARDEFGRDAGDRLAAITGRFDDAPPALRKTNVEIAKLDDLIDDLGRKKPPGFDALIASAEKAKTVVRGGLIDGVAEAFQKPRTLADQAKAAFGQLDAIAADLEQRQPPDWQVLLTQLDQARGAIADGLNRPIRDFVDAQRQSFEIGQLIAAGRQDEADALREIVQLERQGVPLTDAQKAAVLATVQALRAQGREIDNNRAKQLLYLDAIGQMKGIVQDATQAFVRGDLGQLIKSPKKLLDAFLTLKGNVLFDKLFAGAFSKLEDQANGTKIVGDAAAVMASAIDAVTRQTRQLNTAFGDVTTAATSVAGVLRGSPSRVVPAGPALDPGAGGDGVTSLVAAGLGQLAAVAPALLQRGTNDDPDAPPRDVVVTARQTPEQLFEKGIGQISTSIAGIFTNKDSAEAIGKNIGKFAGKGLEGAATGTFVAGVANSLGLKLNGTGAQLGGAIGGITGLPGGQIIGSILGGIAGSLFSKPKSGSATLGNVDGAAGVTGTRGDAGYQKVSSGLAGAVGDSINSIVEQLGGKLGEFAVSIGKRGDTFSIDRSGRGKTKGDGPGGDVASGLSQEEAQAAALADAIADGAIAGLSKAVAKALQSSDDVGKAVAEALKVKDLEKLLGGVTGQLTAIFSEFDHSAAERVRLAKKYGLDLLAVEKLNADQRADLLEETLTARVGSLKEVLKSFYYGDLFEGSAVERRTAILGEIEDAKQDLAAGVDGAADRLAELSQTLVSTSKEAFGTGGSEYGTDRDTARAGINAAIAAETARVTSAAAEQKAVASAVAAGNALADESNDLLAANNAKLDELLALVRAGGSSPASLALTAWKAS